MQKISWLFPFKQNCVCVNFSLVRGCTVDLRRIALDKILRV